MIFCICFLSKIINPCLCLQPLVSGAALGLEGQVCGVAIVLCYSYRDFSFGLYIVHEFLA